MKHTFAALAASTFALGTLVVTTTDASAMLKDPAGGPSGTPASSYDWPDEGSGYPGFESARPEYSYPNYNPAYDVAPVQTTATQSPSHDRDFEGLRLGASALGGAGLAFGSLWLYRRRQLPTT